MKVIHCQVTDRENGTTMHCHVTVRMPETEGRLESVQKELCRRVEVLIG